MDTEDMETWRTRRHTCKNNKRRGVASGNNVFLDRVGGWGTFKIIWSTNDPLSYW